MFSAIVSPNNPRVKNAAQLKESKNRRREGLFLVDGVREVLRAWVSDFEFVEVFWDAGRNLDADERVEVDAVLESVYSDFERRENLRRILIEADGRGVPTIPLSSNAFEKLSFGDRDEGVIAVVKSKLRTLDELDSLLAEKRKTEGEEPLLGIVEGVEKPGNIGAMLRSGDGAGLDAFIIAGDNFDVFNPNAIRGSLGAIFHMPIVVAPADETLAWLRERKIQRATALCDEAIPYVQIDYRLPTAIILGSEAQGLSEAWAYETVEDAKYSLLQRIRLPMLGIADSLNVSNAAAILFYEARRVRSY
ncbi:MAG: RNA methyltransferase [Thermoguttaceae bacterium]|nr:RNA methyltransferase [Thermoguttaceae bacterium]